MIYAHGRQKKRQKRRHLQIFKLLTLKFLTFKLLNSLLLIFIYCFINLMLIRVFQTSGIGDKQLIIQLNEIFSL